MADQSTLRAGAYTAYCGWVDRNIGAEWGRGATCIKAIPLQIFRETPERNDTQRSEKAYAMSTGGQGFSNRNCSKLSASYTKTAVES